MGNENAALAAALSNLHDVLQKVQREAAQTVLRQQDSSSWPEGYFDKTAGAFAHEPFERGPQGDLPEREAW
jgi:hypothetical protein